MCDVMKCESVQCERFAWNAMCEDGVWGDWWEVGAFVGCGWGRFKVERCAVAWRGVAVGLDTLWPSTASATVHLTTCLAGAHYTIAVALTPTEPSVTITSASKHDGHVRV